MSDTGFLVKLGLSAVAVAAFIVPEPASSVTGLAGLFAIWGINWESDGGSS